MAEPYGFRACWSTPILAHSGKALGSFAMYYREPRSPSPAETRALELATHLAGIAIERKLAREERERLRQTQEDLAHINRVTTMGELTASLAHEIKQPITAAVTNARTCLRWLGRDEPDLSEARDAASRIVSDVTRAADIISRISLLFKKGALQHELVDVNELIREMIVLLRNEAARYSIWSAPNWPRISPGHGRPYPVAAGIHELDGEWHRGHEGRIHHTRTYDKGATSQGWPTADLGQRYGDRIATATGGTGFQCVLHYEDPRHRYGIANQPFHYRNPWRTFVGHLRLRAGRQFSFHSAERKPSDVGSRPGPSPERIVSIRRLLVKVGNLESRFLRHHLPHAIGHDGGTR